MQTLFQILIINTCRFALLNSIHAFCTLMYSMQWVHQAIISANLLFAENYKIYKMRKDREAHSIQVLTGKSFLTNKPCNLSNFYFLSARPLMDVSCLYVRCDETSTTVNVIVQFSQSLQVSVVFQECYSLLI